MKRYFVKHEHLFYTFGQAWTSNRALAFPFTRRKVAIACARNLRFGPRQFAGLGSKARVVSVTRKP